MHKFNNTKPGQPIEGGENKITEAQLLLNQEVRVKMGRFAGRTGIVNKVMADGRSLEVTLFDCDKVVFIDVTLVGEIQEQAQFAKGEPDLGPIANSVVQAGK
jgi:transcription antitermination factor NusG